MIPSSAPIKHNIIIGKPDEKATKRNKANLLRNLVLNFIFNKKSTTDKPKT